MVRKESILTLLDKEIDKMTQFYEEKTEKLQRCIVVLKDENSSLHTKNEELQKQQKNPSVENYQDKYELLLKYINGMSGGMPTELIDQLCLSASRTNSLILMEIFWNRYILTTMKRCCTL